MSFYFSFLGLRSHRKYGTESSLFLSGLCSQCGWSWPCITVFPESCWFKGINYFELLQPKRVFVLVVANVPTVLVLLPAFWAVLPKNDLKKYKLFYRDENLNETLRKLHRENLLVVLCLKPFNSHFNSFLDQTLELVHPPIANKQRVNGALGELIRLMWMVL